MFLLCRSCWFPFESLGTCTSSQGGTGGHCGGDRDRSASAPPNPHHPCSALHPSLQTSKCLGTGPVRHWAQAELWRWSRSERFFLQKLRHPCSTLHSSWSVLLLLWNRYTRSRCRVRGARTRGHVYTCSWPSRQTSPRFSCIPLACSPLLEERVSTMVFWPSVLIDLTTKSSCQSCNREPN